MLIGDKLDYAYYTIILKKKKGVAKNKKRRREDSNLRCLSAYPLSKRAH